MKASFHTLPNSSSTPILYYKTYGVEKALLNELRSKKILIHDMEKTKVAQNIQLLNIINKTSRKVMCLVFTTSYRYLPGCL